MVSYNSEFDKQLLDTIRKLTVTKAPNRIAEESGVSITTAKRIKQKSYPSRMSTDVREALVAYRDMLLKNEELRKAGWPEEKRVPRRRSKPKLNSYRDGIMAAVTEVRLKLDEIEYRLRADAIRDGAILSGESVDLVERSRKENLPEQPDSDEQAPGGQSA